MARSVKGNKSTYSGVRRVENSAQMTTIGPDHPAWKGSPPPNCEGHFFRLSPPVGASRDAVDELRAKLIAAGAAAVKVLPIPVVKVVADAVHAVPAPVAADMRSVVMELVAESKVVAPAALSIVVEAALADAGL